MIPAGEIWDEVSRRLRRESREADVALMKRMCNQAYFELCMEEPWDMLVEKTELDFTAADDDGVWLPSEMLGVIDVRGTKTDSFREYVGAEDSDVDEHEECYRYYYSDRVASDDDCLVTGADLSIDEGSNVISSSALAASGDQTGQYIRFGRELRCYKLTSATTISPTYRGPDIANQLFQVRPVGSRKLEIVDPSMSSLRDRSVFLHYWRQPDPLYRESDICVLPIAEPLLLLTMIKSLGVISRRENAADKYRIRLYGSQNRPQDGALYKSRKMNPKRFRRNRPRDIRNQPFSFDTDLFQPRTGNRWGGTGFNRQDGWLRG